LNILVEGYAIQQRNIMKQTSEGKYEYWPLHPTRIGKKVSDSVISTRLKASSTS
jgi:hypothetical protein